MHRQRGQPPALVSGAEVIGDRCLVVALFDMVHAHRAAQSAGFEDVPLEQFAFERRFAGVSEVSFSRLDGSEAVDLGQEAMEVISVGLD